MRLLIDTNIVLEVLLAQEHADEARALLSASDGVELFLSDFAVHSIGCCCSAVACTTSFGNSWRIWCSKLG